MTKQELARLQERAGQNDPEALYRLAMLRMDGDGVPEDNGLAAALLLRAARQGHAEAQYNLDVCCHHGEGVEKDMEDALRWYRLSAAQDDPYARQALEALSAGAENAAGRPIE